MKIKITITKNCSKYENILPLNYMKKDNDIKILIPVEGGSLEILHEHLNTSYKIPPKGGLLYMPQLAPLPINELGKGALEMVELRFMYVPGAGHAGIHRNPESSNHLVPSH